MLRSSKKPALTEVQPTHVDVFVEKYDMLKGWAARLSDRDRDLADDLLHDTFIQFVLNKPDLDVIQNIDGYLYTVMRNLHLAQVRRANRIPLRSLTVVEYDTAELSFWASDARDRIRLRDELEAVCRYACIRKETAKAASVLILRFFHGYYPEEIALVMRSHRSAVEKRLRSARLEARSYLNDPDGLAFINGKATTAVRLVGSFSEDLRFELRRQIFGSRQGDCLVEEVLRERYHAEHEADSIDRCLAAHIVSCPICLDIVNKKLGLAPLASRYPLDTLGKDPGKRGGDGEGEGEGGTGGDFIDGGSGAGGSKMLDSYLRRLDAHFHHLPEELCISVNGQLQTYQKVVAGKGELTLVIDSAESTGFIEILSEQGVRLLMLNVEPPPVGDSMQTGHVNLSDGRTIDAALSFGGAFPSLQVIYNDPNIALAGAAADGAVLSAPPATMRPLPEPDEKPELADIARDSWRWFDIRLWLQPGKLTTAFAVLLLATLIGIWLFKPAITKTLRADSILNSAANIESTMIADTQRVVHRNYQIEEWQNGSLLTRHRVDQWQKANTSAKRIYDESGKMVAGEWGKQDGTRQIFRHGERLRTVDENASVTEIEPTIAGFKKLVDSYGVTPSLTVQESSSSYVLSYKERKSETPNRLLLASLTLDRESLLAESETVVLNVGDESHEYRLSDVRVEQKPLAEVSPLIFEPESELTKGATNVTKPLQMQPVSEPETAASGTVATGSPMASLDTEVEVFKALDSVNALSGDQISVTRDAQGRLRVAGIVDSPARKTEILNALASVRYSPGVVIDVQTAAEAANKQKKVQTPAGNKAIETLTAETSRPLPVESDLRAYFAKRGTPDDRMGEEVRSFSSSVLNRAEALSRNALALKSLAERFSAAELDRLEPKKRNEWHQLLRSKAGAVAGDVRSLQSQLSTVFGSQNVGGADADDDADAADITRSAQRLYGLAAACERQLNQSFAISGGGESAPVKSAQFWRNLRQMGTIAAEMEKF